MTEKSPKTIPVSSGAEAFLAQMKELGSVRYMFANTGTDHGPLIEAMAKTAKEDPRDIQPIVVPHEQAAVSMAHGYYNVTQKPQMVLVHTLPGTANALGGIINAASCNVPLFLVAGRTPITEGELRAGKSQNIHWRQESRDQGNIVREFVKWDYEVRTNQNLAAVVSRAYKISMSEPRGPVYMTLPREWLFEAMESTQLLSPESLSPASKMQADQASLEKAADWLIASESPLIVTKYLGRNPEAVQYLIELAELLALPVVQQLSYVNFPTDHPLNLGTQTTKYVRNSDLLFFIDTDVPWEPPNRNVLRDGVKIIHLERDPMFTGIPGWGFPADLPVTGCSDVSLPVLTGIIRAKLAAGAAVKSKIDERRKKTEAEHNEMIREMDASVGCSEKPKADQSRLAIKVHRRSDGRQDNYRQRDNYFEACRSHSLEPPGFDVQHAARGSSWLGAGRGHRHEARRAGCDGDRGRRRRLLHVLRSDGLSLYGAEISDSVFDRDLQQPGMERESQCSARFVPGRRRSADAQLSRHRLEPVAELRADGASLRRLRCAGRGAWRSRRRDCQGTQSCQGRGTAGAAERGLSESAGVEGLE